MSHPDDPIIIPSGNWTLNDGYLLFRCPDCKKVIEVSCRVGQDGRTYRAARCPKCNFFEFVQFEQWSNGPIEFY